jgi:hypothetical protein
VGRGRSLPVPPRPVADVPIGRLDIRRLDVAPPPPAPEGVRGLHLSVVADGVPMSAFATALADATRAGIVLDDRLVGVRVSVALPNVQVARLFELLRDLYDVVPLTEADDRFLFVSRERVAEPGMRPRLPEEPPPEVAPLETRLFPVPGHVPAADVAASFCHHHAGERGSASVVGDAVVATDVAERLSQLETLLTALNDRRARRVR